MSRRNPGPIYVYPPPLMPIISQIQIHLHPNPCTAYPFFDKKFCKKNVRSWTYSRRGIRKCSCLLLPPKRKFYRFSNRPARADDFRRQHSIEPPHPTYGGWAGPVPNRCTVWPEGCLRGRFDIASQHVVTAMRFRSLCLSLASTASSRFISRSVKTLACFISKPHELYLSI